MPKGNKMPKPQKLARPKTKDLRGILKGLLTVSLNNRIASLSYALQWYDGAIPYLWQRKYITISTDPKNPTKEQKALNTAVACRNRGINPTTPDHEKEVSFLTAVRHYEKACHKLKPPSVDKFYGLFKNKKDKLESKQNRMASKFGSVITTLQKAIGNRLKLTVADAAKPFQYDPGLTSLSYNRDAAKALALKFRQQGLLAVVVDQLDLMTRHAALQPDGKGGWEYYPEKQVEVIQDVLNNFITYAASADAPKRLVRRGHVPQPTNGAAQGATQAASTTPRPKGTFGGNKGPKIGGVYVPGTCGAIFYERLQDGKEWTLTNLFDGVAHAHPIGPLKKMAKDGPPHGWTVKIGTDKAQLVKVQP
jgi:hypothetical protein